MYGTDRWKIQWWTSLFDVIVEHSLRYPMLEKAAIKSAALAAMLDHEIAKDYRRQFHDRASLLKLHLPDMIVAISSVGQQWIWPIILSNRENHPWVFQRTVPCIVEHTRKFWWLSSAVPWSCNAAKAAHIARLYRCCFQGGITKTMIYYDVQQGCPSLDVSTISTVHRCPWKEFLWLSSVIPWSCNSAKAALTPPYCQT